MLRLAVYLGIGAICHAVFVGPQFDWSSAWTWGWLLGWPIAFIAAFWSVILALLVVGLAVGAACLIASHFIDQHKLRQRREAHRKRIYEMEHGPGTYSKGSK